ncbi:MAG: outer membrane beta-barrel protein [Deltaproteobacteria bacterium]|jgi:hypothetical protein|nr:outer membrane beta-barrel protein [Deltaproteobacteria bacterium]MBT6490979.1 outer membrane beta-barrel protein [Deltaproteobacteria bacterium]
MNRLKLNALIVSLSLMAFSSTALADSMLDLQANLGVAHILPDEGDGVTGFGLDVVVGLPLALGVVPEVMVGYLSNESGGITYGNLMVMGGLRFDVPMPMLTPYVYAHFGLCSFTASIGDFSTPAESELGMNLGAGVRYMLADTLGVGVSAGPVLVFMESGMGKYIRGNVSAFFTL